MNLLSAIKNTPDTYTENGAPTYSTTFNANLDFFAQASAKRNNLSNALDLFMQAFLEDKTLAVKNLFYLRDVREGNGERAIFLACLSSLIDAQYETYPKEINALLVQIPEFGRWKDLFDLIGVHSSADTYIIHDIIKNELESELARVRQGEKIPSLFAKWFPLSNCVKDEKRKQIARRLCSELFKSNYANCRKTITSLRKNSVVEQTMSAKQFSDIEYGHVPSCAFLKYTKAFKRHDPERFQSFLEDVRSGQDKINANVLYPYQIVSKILHNESYEALDEIWNSLPNITDGRNSLAVVDISGSMFDHRISKNVAPIDISVSLGIYLAERNKGKFHNHFITFSKKAQLVEIKGTTIQEKVRFVRSSDFMGFNTNLQSVFSCILNAAKQHHVPKEEMPEVIYIISDMEFDDAVQDKETTNHDEIKRKYADAGYDLPTIVFWNVASHQDNVPVTKDEKNVLLISGFSPSILKRVLTNVTPLDFMLSVLQSDRYKEVQF